MISLILVTHVIIHSVRCSPDSKVRLQQQAVLHTTCFHTVAAEEGSCD
jgi:hypothetical protein